MTTAAFTLNAQQPASTPPPLPPGPLLNKAPDFVQWTITIKSAESGGVGKTEKGIASPEPSAKPTAEVYQIVTAKTGKIRHEVRVAGTQIMSNVWSINGASVEINPKTKIAQVAPGGVSVDFPGLEWISEKNYTDVKKINGKDTIIFNDKVAWMAANGATNEFKGKVDAVAYIDLETRLPIAMKRGVDTYTYQFGAMPQTTLTPPPEVVQAMEGYSERMKRLSAGPAREP